MLAPAALFVSDSTAASLRAVELNTTRSLLRAFCVNRIAAISYDSPRRYCLHYFNRAENVQQAHGIARFLGECIICTDVGSLGRWRKRMAYKTASLDMRAGDVLAAKGVQRVDLLSLFGGGKPRRVFPSLLDRDRVASAAHTRSRMHIPHSDFI